MELPKIDLPIHYLTIPSTGKKYKFRPFVVKEEKLLLIASESKDVNEIINTTLQVVNNCSLDDELKISKLPYFDIDYLFIALRAKSVGENITIKFSCNNIVEGNRCGGEFPVVLDIANVALKTIDREKKIELEGGKGLTLRYPTYPEMKLATTKQTDFEKKIAIMVGSIDYIFDAEQTYHHKDYTTDQLTEFVENMTEGTFKKLEKWVESFPSFYVASTGECTKCGFVHSIAYDKFNSFFLS